MELFCASQWDLGKCDKGAFVIVVMLGAALFGVAGALLAIPVGAMLISIADLRHKRYAVRDDLVNITETESGAKGEKDSKD